ncbi:MAG: hypothetical protein CK548_04880 [Opitutia bacterium]|nr:MAG: hypothetical protein CK548_04880 [Opitutae bacterium]
MRLSITPRGRHRLPRSAAEPARHQAGQGKCEKDSKPTVSVLKQIGDGFTVGFVVGGGSSSTVLVRAIGPGLAAVGLTSGFVPDPKLTLFSGSTKINENGDWDGTAPLTAAFRKVGAFPVPGTSLDAALLATLQPGSYSVQVAGVTAENGLVIVEVYEVP